MASTKVGDGLVVPGRPALGHGVPFLQRVGGQGGPGEEPQQGGGGAGDGPVGPLALGLHAQVGPHLLKGDLPVASAGTNHSRIWAGSADGSVQSRACGSKVPWGSRISTQRMVTGGLPERYTPRSES